MPDFPPHSVIHGLPLMTFRGLDAPPYDVANVDFSHSHGVRPYPYIDGAAHDWAGLDQLPLTFTLHFLNSLEEGLFPDVWEEWRKELFNGEHGEMVHPLLGPLNVVPRRGSIRLVASSTAGIVVDVTFESTVLDPEEEQAFEAIRVNLKELAAMAKKESDDAEIPFPSEEEATDLTQMGDQIDGAIAQVDLAVDGLINDMQRVVSDMIGIADRKPGHEFYVARDALVALWAGLEDLGTSAIVQQERDTATFELRATTTLDAFARERNNTLAEIITLNPSALATPSVERGTSLRYYTS